jgi:tRNA dimethylallyltransferase
MDLFAASEEKPLLVVLGPTGSGKSGLALAIAEQFDGEIVNCDSVQVYAGLEIGSAKTPIHERRGIAHHLIDIAGPGVDYTAGDFSRDARSAIAGITARRKLPIICGGTGLYLRALLCGLSPAPSRNENLRNRLNTVAERRPSALHRLLKARDTTAASRIHRNDLQKLIRAIEITYMAAEAATDVQNRPRDSLTGYRVLKIGLDPDRALLYQRLNERTDRMFRDGLIQETNQLLSAGYDPNSKALQSLGYKQALQAIDGQLSYSDAVRECQTKTRQYAKRQMTWFRAETEVEWLKGFGEYEQVRAAAFAVLKCFVNSL